MVAAAVACWIPCVPAAAAGMPLPQVPLAADGSDGDRRAGLRSELTWHSSAARRGLRDHRLPDRDVQQRSTRRWDEVEDDTESTAHHIPGTQILLGTPSCGIASPPSTLTGRENPSLHSNQVEITGTTGPGTPGAPRGLTAAAEGTAIRLNWEVPFPTAGKTISGYRVDVSTNDGRQLFVSEEYDRDGVPSIRVSR